MTEPYCFICGNKNDTTTGKCTNSACPRYVAPTASTTTTTSTTSTAN